ncbi:MAG: hypothetical protein AABW59_03125 [archaeon]
MVVKNVLRIVVGGDFDKDFSDILSGKASMGDYVENEIYLDSFAHLDKLLSPKKLDLLKFLSESQLKGNPKSVTMLAKSLNRKQEAISRDIKQLDGLGLVSLKKSKQTVYAIPKYCSIEIRTA